MVTCLRATAVAAVMLGIVIIASSLMRLSRFEQYTDAQRQPVVHFLHPSEAAPAEDEAKPPPPPVVVPAVPPPDLPPSSREPFLLDRELQTAKDIDWGEYRQCLQSRRMPSFGWIRTYVLNHLLPASEAEQVPPAPLRVTKRPVPLPDPAHIDCGNKEYAKVLTGRHLASPRKIYDTFPYGWEIDLLEIRMYELGDVVDRFFVMESRRTQNGWEKPLLFKKYADRIKQWMPKIEVSVWDPPSKTDVLSGSDWSLEKGQREKGYEMTAKYAWNDSDAIAIADDVDMIPSAYFLWHLKHCEMIPEAQHNFQMKMGTFWGSLDTVQVMSRPARFANAKGVSDRVANHNYDYWPSKVRMGHGCHGIHVNKYGGGATLALKHMAVIEYNLPRDPDNDNVDTGLWVAKNLQASHAKQVRKGALLSHSRNYFVPLGGGKAHVDFDKAHYDCDGSPYFIPWVVANNPDRYPMLVHPNFNMSLLPTGRTLTTEHFTVI